MKVLVTGAAGMLGSAFSGSCPLGVELICTDVDQLDITDGAAVADALGAAGPDAVVNLAAFTAVDHCESHEEAALAINAAGPGNLARACRGEHIPLLHVSTDYVFDGALAQGEEYDEQAPTAPLSAYGRTKLAGEQAVASACQAHWIVRTQWLYGLGGPNFVETMLRLAAERERLTVVDDQWGSPTSTHTLAPLLWKILEQRPEHGIYHAVNSGHCSWYQFAREIFEQSSASVTLEAMDSSGLDRPAPRPARAILGTSKLRQALGLEITPWRSALSDYLRRRKNEKDSSS